MGPIPTLPQEGADRPNRSGGLSPHPVRQNVGSSGLRHSRGACARAGTTSSGENPETHLPSPLRTTLSASFKTRPVSLKEPSWPKGCRVLLP